MGKLAILFEALDKMDAARPKCRDCSRCAERTGSQGMCWALSKLVGYDDPASKCSYFRASQLRAPSETKPKYGHLKLPRAG